jgi:hypothetical protein
MTQSKTLASLLAVLGTAILSMALLAPFASAKEPAAGYERFAGCPSPEENPAVTVCQRAVITGGHFQMGSKDVPLENPITLSGGTNAKAENFSANAKGGLTPVQQKVPGGVVGLTGLTWLLEFFGNEALTLYAVTELVGAPKLTPTAFELPIRVHLINPGGLLGNSCYVGSPASPIQLKLATGTTAPPPPNEPITGKAPKFGFGTPAGVSRFSEGIFVDNSFAAPGANGCVLSVFGIPFSINGLVNEQSGLPSPAGTNETIQNFELEIVASKFVYP